MAAELNPMELGEKVSWVVAFFVALFSALAVRFGWKKAGTGTAVQEVTTTSSSDPALNHLKQSLERLNSAVRELAEITEDNGRREKRSVDLLAECLEEIRDLNRVLQNYVKERNH